MSDGTSVGKVQLDIEISKSSLNTELNKLGKVFSNGLNNNFKGMFSGMASQMNNFVKDSIGKMNSGLKNFSQSGTNANEKVTQSINKMNSEYEKTEAKIAEIRKEYAKLFAEQDAIVKNFQDMPAFSGMSKEESLEHMLRSNPRYIELSEQIDSLMAKMDPLKEKNKALADQIKNVGDSASNTGNNLNVMGDISKKAGNEAKKSSFKIKLFGNEMKKSGIKAAGFANMLTNSFMRVLKRIFILNLIYKAIRGFINYLNSALKTNKDFVNSLTTIKTNLKVAFQPIYDFILPALNTLMRAVAMVTTYIASAISALFGKSYKQSFDSAKGIEKSKKAMDGFGSSAKKAQNTLMGFDEINQLDISDDEAGGGVGEHELEMPDLATIDMTGMEEFKNMLADLFKPFKDAWANEGLNVINAAKYAFENIKSLLKSIGDSWREVWTNGTGQLMLETILRIIQNILDLVGNLAAAFTEAWRTNDIGTKIIQHTFDLLNIILGTIEKITKATADWAKTLDFTPLLNSIDGLLQALAPLTQNIGDGLVWFWENALLPIAGWVLEDAIPVFLDMLAEAIRVLNTVIEALKPLGEWLWENFLKPLGEWTGGIIVSVLDGIKDGLKAIGDWIDDNQGTVQTMAIIAGSFAAAWGLVNIAVGVWNVIGVIATGVTGAFGAAVAFLTSPIGIAVAAIGTLIAIGVLLYKNWDEVKAWLINTWENISTKATELWEGMKQFFEETWENIKNKTEEIWNGIKTFLEKIWNPITNTVSEIWNGIKEFILEKWDAIKEGIAEKKDDLVDAIKKPFNIAKEWIDGIISDAFDWGKNLIQSFIDGIKSMARKVADAAAAIAGKVAGFLGFQSPTDEGPGRYADEWMPNFMDMIAEGIESNIDKIKKSVKLTTEVLQNVNVVPTIPQPTLTMFSGRTRESSTPFDDNSLESLTSAIVNALLQILPLLGGTGNNESYDTKELVLNIEGTPLVRILLPLINNELSRLGYRTLFQVN